MPTKQQIDKLIYQAEQANSAFRSIQVDVKGKSVELAYHRGCMDGGIVTAVVLLVLYLWAKK